MIKFLTRCILLVATLFVIIFLLQRAKLLPSFGNIFGSQPVVIDSTPILVKEIKSLSQLITITAYNELVVDSVKPFAIPIMPGMSVPIHAMDDHLVLIGKGRVLAGVDLSKIQDKDIYVKDDSVSIILPKAEILQVITNPSDFETFEEKGDWTDKEVTAVKIKLQRKMIAAVTQQNILPKAAATANVMMENFMRSVGFTKVSVQ